MNASIGILTKDQRSITSALKITPEAAVYRDRNSCLADFELRRMSMDLEEVVPHEHGGRNNQYGVLSNQVVYV